MKLLMPSESYSHLPGGPDRPAARSSGASAANTVSTRMNRDSPLWRCLLLGALSWAVLFTLYRWLG